MSQRVLTVNAGSSSVKLRLLDGRDVVERNTDLPAGPDGFDAARLADELRTWPEPDVVAHRIVHGGTTFTGPARMTPEVRDELRKLTDLAPLHQPKSLAALDAVADLLPD
ncbi:MAG: acetate/propionate family kinase, partial [Actinomycetota bacterium]|nr:acetate/propionate family kinase [Actinomycetota bacterium]